VACVLLVASAASGSASAGGLAMQAQPKGTAFAVPHYVIAGGGGRSTGGAFAITGTLGQADADPLQPSTGGVFAITGGFWPGIVPSASPGDPIFADGFE
jgi:hypothetical protein